MKNSSLNQNQSLIQVIQKERVQKTHKNSLHFLFLAIGIVSGFFILGFIDTSHTLVPQEMPEEAQTTDTNNMMENVRIILLLNTGKHMKIVLHMGVVNLLQSRVPLIMDLYTRGYLICHKILRMDFPILYFQFEEFQSRRIMMVL